jgi:hypothetical protein
MSVVPSGEMAGIAQLRTGFPTDVVEKTGAFASRSNVEVTVSPPMMSVEPLAETEWHVLQLSVTPAAAKKSSGAPASG